MKNNGADSVSFLTFSELQLCVDGVSVVSRHRDAVDAALRESTRLPRQFRDGVRATQDEDAGREVGPPQEFVEETEVRGGHGVG